MVHGANRSRSRKRVHVRTVTGTKLRFEETKPGKPTCSCGRPLQGVARGTQTQLRKLSKTQKRPSRPFAGQLCPVCLKASLRAQARLSQD